MDDDREAWFERHSSKPPNPLTKPGETLPLSRILELLPQADENLMRDVDAAQCGTRTRR